MNLTSPLDARGARARIAAIERWALEGATAPLDPPIWGQIQGFPLIRITGQAAYWEHPDGARATPLDDLLTGISGLRIPFHYLIVSTADGTGVYVGLFGQDAETIMRSVLTGVFPALHLADGVSQVGRTLERAGMFRQRGRLTGVPSVQPPGRAHVDEASPPREVAVPGVDTLLRGMAGARWGMFVRAEPVSHKKLAVAANDCMDEIAATAAATKRQLSEVTQRMLQLDPSTQEGTTRSVSAELTNRHAGYLLTLLESNLERYRSGLARGAWETEVHLFADSETSYHRLEAVARAAFAGDGPVEPMRVARCGPSSDREFTTLLTSPELAMLCGVPRVEAPGFRITDYATFDVDPPQMAGPSIAIGEILHGGQPSGVSFRIPIAGLAKHAFVCGVTGSGKTTMVLGLLSALWNSGRGQPFLVIEPAKSEYRCLKGVVNANGAWSGPIPDVDVYTVGDETTLPFRLNPFEFEIVDESLMTQVQTHIDLLKSAFNAAFPLYPPMPYVLETCLHEIYTDRGWDLMSGRNRRVAPGKLAECVGLVFPTLGELYDKIDAVTERLGYDRRIQMDVTAGLKARIGSLLTGAKGTMLNTRRGAQMKDLLSRPTVLELERLGSDDEKAFVIGLLLMRLYEYRRLHSESGGVPGGLLHITVLEEAHRLLKNVSPEVDLERASSAAQAVETFANMISEIRAYGEGFVIAEQIPTKIAPDAIKNSNLKVALRLVSRDDRALIGGAMNMSEAQQNIIGSLDPGEAALFAEGADHPYLARVPDFRATVAAKRPSDEDLRSRSATGPVGPLTLPERSIVGDLMQQIRSEPQFELFTQRLIFASVFVPTNAKAVLQDLRACLQRVAAGSGVAAEAAVEVATLSSAMRHALDRRGRQYRWRFDAQAALEAYFVRVMETLHRGESPPQELYERIRVTYASLAHAASDNGPFIGCEACLSRCMYRAEGAQIASEPMTVQTIRNAYRESVSEEQLVPRIAAAARGGARRVAGDTLPPALADGLVLCGIVQANDRLSASVQNQRRVGVAAAALLAAASGEGRHRNGWIRE